MSLHRRNKRLPQATAAGLAGLGMLIGAMGSPVHADSPVNPDNPPQNASALAQSEKDRSYFFIIGGGTTEFYSNVQENSILSIPLEIYHGLKSLGIDDEHIKLFFYRSPFMRQCEGVVATYSSSYEPALYNEKGVAKGDEAKARELIRKGCLADNTVTEDTIISLFKDGRIDFSKNLLIPEVIDYPDDQATKANLERELKNLPPRARLYVFHSGHGDKYGYAVGLGVGLTAAEINEYLQGVDIEQLTWVHKSSYAQVFTDGLDVGNKKMVRMAATDRENNGNGFFPRYLVESLRKDRNHINISLWNAIKEMYTWNEVEQQNWPFTEYSGGASPNDFFLWDFYPFKIYIPVAVRNFSAGW